MGKPLHFQVFMVFWTNVSCRDIEGKGPWKCRGCKGNLFSLGFPLKNKSLAILIIKSKYIFINIYINDDFFYFIISLFSKK
jgi:hypothetical protein